MGMMNERAAEAAPMVRSGTIGVSGKEWYERSGRKSVRGILAA